MHKIHQEKQLKVKPDDSISEIIEEEEDEFEQFHSLISIKISESTNKNLYDFQPTNTSSNNSKLYTDIHSQSQKKTIDDLLHSKSTFFEIAKVYNYIIPSLNFSY